MRKCQIIKTGFALLAFMAAGITTAQTDSTSTDSTLNVIDTAMAPVMVNDTAMFIDTFPVIDTNQQVVADAVPDYVPRMLPYGMSLESLSLRMITGQTTHVLNKNVLEFCVQHRFGYFNQGKDQFYGFDQSDVRLGFDYGLTRQITIGIGRSSLGKTYNGYVKAKIMKQSDRFPLTLAWLSDMSISGLKNTDPDLNPFYASHRYKYAHQLFVSRSFGERAMLTLAPSVIHHNLVDSTKYPNDMGLLVVNARIKIRQGLNITGEYSYIFNHDVRQRYTPCIGAGFELYTSGHIFQIVFSNSNSMNEADSYAMKNGKISNGDIRMGFNIVRQF